MFTIPLERNLDHPVPAHIATDVKIVVSPGLSSNVKCRGMVQFLLLYPVVLLLLRILWLLAAPSPADVYHPSTDGHSRTGMNFFANF
jgi:hypothetical protein